MKKTLYTLLALLTLTATPLKAQEALPKEQKGRILINNRILTSVNDKPISLLDVVKKMDLFLTKNYPEYLDDEQMRYQFYATQWQSFFEQLVDTEFILADANEKSEKNKAIKITDAEVRKEMLERYGPNVFATLEKIDISLEEAQKLVFAELMEHRILGAFIYPRADQQMTPTRIETAYANYVKQNPAHTQWEYQVLTVRSKQHELSEKLAERAFTCASDETIEPTELISKLQSQDDEEEQSAEITASKDFVLADKSISNKHRDVLVTLTTGSYSRPIKQKDESYKIFYLKNKTDFTPETFEQMYSKIREEQFNNLFNEAQIEYTKNLRKHFGFDMKAVENAVPKNFQPFTFNQ